MSLSLAALGIAVLCQPAFHSVGKVDSALSVPVATVEASATAVATSNTAASAAAATPAASSALDVAETEGQALPSPAELLPEKFSAHSENELLWRGLASLYPNEVLTAPPPSFSRRAPAPPLEAQLTRGITYLRIYDPAQSLDALQAIDDPQRLILDLRYLNTPLTPEVEQRLSKLGSEQPLIVLINSRTAGDIEPQLADLQAQKHILTVGTATAGQTGSYRPLPGPSRFYLLEDETLTAAGRSLLGHGLAPSVPVEVSPRDDYVAYQLVEGGTPVENVLQMEFETEGHNRTTPVFPKLKSAADPILQRGVDVIVALQVVGLLPPS